MFNMCTDVNAYDCTHTVRESALKIDSGEKSLAAPGNHTVSAARWSDALPT